METSACGSTNRMDNVAILWVRNHIIFFLAILTYITSLVISSGSLASSDTAIRLAVAHRFWQGTSIFDKPDPRALVGRNGLLYPPYGMGQSLLMLPADMIATPIATLMAKDEAQRIKIRQSLVALAVFPLLSAITIPIVFLLLTKLGFNKTASVAGCIAFLFGTTFLPYSKIHYENSLITFLFVTGISTSLNWLKTGSRYSLVSAAIACGFMLLTRLTTVIDIMIIGMILASTVFIFSERTETNVALRTRFIDLLIIGLPILFAFALADRLYQLYRFGNLTSTYINIQSKQARASDPSLPENWPFNRPFWDGFYRQTFGLYKSIFAYDPLMFLSLGLIPVCWKRLTAPMRSFAVCSLLFVLAQLSFYSKCIWLGGDFAWGNRYLTTSSQMASLLGVPLLIQEWRSLKPFVRRIGVGILLMAILVQIVSVVLPHGLEVSQALQWNGDLFAVKQRIVNIIAIATGNYYQWNLSTHTIDELMAWNHLPHFTPFNLSQQLSPSLVKVLLLGWVMLIFIWVITLITVLSALRSMNSENERSVTPVSNDGSIAPCG